MTNYNLLCFRQVYDQRTASGLGYLSAADRLPGLYAGPSERRRRLSNRLYGRFRGVLASA